MSAAIELTPLIIEGIQEKKGKGISVIDLSEIEGASAHTFIICEGNTPTQVSAIADSVRDTVLAGAGRKPLSSGGYTNSTWIILDYGDTVLHVFVPEERKRYDLEELWSDGILTQIPDIL